MRGTLEAKQELVETDVTVRGEAVAHRCEVYRAMMFMDLDGVTATESDLRASFAGEMGEDALAADLAPGAWAGCGDFGVFAGPEVVGEQGSTHEIGLVGEEFKSLCDLKGCGEIYGRGENAGGVAGLHGACGRLGKDAGEAGGGIPGYRLRIIPC